MIFRRSNVAELTTPDGYTNLEPVLADGPVTAFRAVQEGLGRTVLLYIAGQPDDFDRIRHVLANLPEHPGIATVYDAGRTTSGHPYVATACPGSSLSDRIAMYGGLPPATAIRITARLADALAAAHSAGIVHGDVRPEYVRSADERIPVLSGFGPTSPTGRGSVASQEPTALVHHSPEVLEGSDPGPPDDIYALASTLYTMLAGEPLHRAAADIGLAALIQRKLERTPPVLRRPGMTTELMSVIRRGLAADPADRYGSAAEFGKALRDLDAEPAQVTPLPQSPPQARVPDKPAVVSPSKPAVQGPWGTERKWHESAFADPASATAAAAIPPSAPAGPAVAATGPAGPAVAATGPATAAIPPSAPVRPPVAPSAPAPVRPPVAPSAPAPAEVTAPAPVAPGLAPSAPARAEVTAPVPVRPAVAPPAPAPAPVRSAVAPSAPAWTEISAPDPATTGIPSSVPAGPPIPEPGRVGPEATVDPAIPPALDVETTAERPEGNRSLIVAAAALAVVATVGVIGLVGHGGRSAAVTPQGASGAATSPQATPTVTQQAAPLTKLELTRYQPAALKAVPAPQQAVLTWRLPPDAQRDGAGIIIRRQPADGSDGVIPLSRTDGRLPETYVAVPLKPGQQYCFLVGVLLKRAGGAMTFAQSGPVCAAPR